MDLGLADKVAIVTGSSRGLGLAIARSLAEEGCRVCLSARGQEGLAQATAELGSEEKVLAVAADLSTRDGVEAVVARTVERFGGLDILVNNVALAGGAGLLDTPDETWQEAFDHTLLPAVRASRAAVPHLRARGGGVIAVVASIWGRESGGRMAYNAIKAAEISFAKAASRELAKDGIRVFSVAPGSILFPGGSWWKRREADPGAIAAFVERELPFGRFGRAEEVGDVVAFLCSARASWVSGASIVIDGGQSRSNL